MQRHHATQATDHADSAHRKLVSANLPLGLQIIGLGYNLHAPSPTAFCLEVSPQLVRLRPLPAHSTTHAESSGTLTPKPAASMPPPTTIATQLAAVERFWRSQGRSLQSSSDAVPRQSV